MTWAVSTTVPLFGALTGTKYTPTLQPPLPERTWVYSVDRAGGEVGYQALDSDYRVLLPLRPFHGTIGVAPAAGEARNVLVPEAFGGNMDTPEARAGTTIYLGVNVEGALFSLGDGHYTMGEGEVCGVAVEGAMNTVLVVDVIKDVYCEWPRMENDDAIMVAGSYRPLEDAFRIAHTQLIQWISSNTGLSIMDTYQLVTQASTSPIANVCDANYTIVAKIAKRYLPEVDWMSGVHDRLRQAGRAATITHPAELPADRKFRLRAQNPILRWGFFESPVPPSPGRALRKPLLYPPQRLAKGDPRVTPGVSSRGGLNA